MGSVLYLVNEMVIRPYYGVRLALVTRPEDTRFRMGSLGLSDPIDAWCSRNPGPHEIFVYLTGRLKKRANKVQS